MPPERTFSAVVTSYEVGHRIERAVESLVNQSLDGVEIVVIDDASRDEETNDALDHLEGTVKIERFAEQNGVAVARNRGLVITSSPYVVCLDGDDWLEPRYLEMAKEMFDADPALGIVSAWVRWEGRRQGEWRPANFDLTDLMATNQIHSASTFRRSASESVGSYYEKLDGYEDWEHWISIMAAGWKSHVIPEFLLHYDLRPNSLGRSANQRARQLVDIVVGLHEDLYRTNVRPILAAKIEQTIALEREVEAAWERGEELQSELQRAWTLVEELGAKLEDQGRGIEGMEEILRRTRDHIRHLEEQTASEQFRRDP